MTKIEKSMGYNRIACKSHNPKDNHILISRFCYPKIHEIWYLKYNIYIILYVYITLLPKNT